MKNKLFAIVTVMLIVLLGLSLGTDVVQAEKVNIALSGKAQTLDPAFLQRSISE